MIFQKIFPFIIATLCVFSPALLAKKPVVEFSVKTPIKVLYNVEKSNQRMRAVIFQDGQLYTTDDDEKRDLKGNWCILQVKLELDQDTLIHKGDHWRTMKYSALDNNSHHTVYAYSFVDPNQGKVTQKFKRYTPFNLSCQVKKSEVFNAKMWRHITGNRIKLNYKKQEKL